MRFIYHPSGKSRYPRFKRPGWARSRISFPHPRWRHWAGFHLFSDPNNQFLRYLVYRRLKQLGWSSNRQARDLYRRVRPHVPLRQTRAIRRFIQIIRRRYRDIVHNP